MPPAFCALDEVYSDWSFKQPNANQPSQLNKQSQQISVQQNHPSLKPIQQQQQTNNHFEEQEQQEDVYIPKNEGVKSFCPNCSNCLNANNVLQQRIIEQNIWPRQRWTPQDPYAYAPYDPFNRYWMNNVPQSHREDFGNVGRENFGNLGTFKTENLLQIILCILIALFLIQLLECFNSKNIV